MSEYLCVTLRGGPGESESAFKARLTNFWTHMLRTRPDQYEKIYAEEVRSGVADGRVSRTYMVEAEVIEMLIGELTRHGIDLAPIDLADVYTKYEAASPDWFQIEH